MAVQKNRIELYEKFKLQVDLLVLACKNFDDGHEIASYHLAITLRVLLHDTHTSVSGLTHIRKKGIQFLDTASDMLPDSTYLGLVYRSFNNVHDGIGGEVLYKPNFTNGFHLKNKKWSSFQEWWKKIVFRNINGTSLTREELILKVANREGGAHIDKIIDQKYELFSKNYSGGTTVMGMKSGIVRQFDNVPVLPAVRQVAYELLSSLENATLTNVQ